MVRAVGVDAVTSCISMTPPIGTAKVCVESVQLVALAPLIAQVTVLLAMVPPRVADERTVNVSLLDAPGATLSEQLRLRRVPPSGTDISIVTASVVALVGVPSGKKKVVTAVVAPAPAFTLIIVRLDDENTVPVQNIQ